VSSEVKVGSQSRIGLLAGRSPLLRLQSDDKLIALIRAGNEAAFEHLFDRYRSRLMAFSRHMLGSKEDAEDVMQEVFVNAYNAMRADEREINVRPWLYRIARNRCLNHLRKPVPDGQDTMDEFVGATGTSTAEVVHKRADLRHLLEDVQKLPETQRTALLMREIDVLSYDQIADAMETTVPSVKSLLVRARMSLAEASQARALTCDDVRMQLAEVTEGIKKITPPLKRHVRECEECQAYRKQLRKTNTAMAMALPVGPLMVVKKLFAAKVGFAVFGGGKGAAAAGGTTAAAGGVAATGAGSAASVGVSAAVTKAAVGLALTAVVAGGAVEANKAVHKKDSPRRTPVHTVAPTASQPSGGVTSAQASDAARRKRKRERAEEQSAATTGDQVASDDLGNSNSTSDGSSGSSGGGSGDDVSPSTGGGSGGGTGSETGGPPPEDIAPATGGSPPPTGGGTPLE
jgi:RNA polymerase sigma factor (sigma-70 family)